MLLADTLHGAMARADLLAPLLFAGFVVGEFLARGPFTHLLAKLQSICVTLARKLDRDNRSVATRVYRGIVAVLMLLVPAMLTSGLLAQPVGWLQLLLALLLVAWFGHCLQPFASMRLLARAKTGTLALELPGLDYLFADSHAAIRYCITIRYRAFAVGVVGGCFWFVAGGPIAMAAYLALAAAHAHYQHRLAFGWAVRALFALMNSMPTILARALIFLAAFFTPHTKPFGGLFAKTWLGGIATTLAITLGGPTPMGETPWVGSATARLTATHLRRALHLAAVATLLLLLLLAHQEVYKLLIFMV